MLTFTSSKFENCSHRPGQLNGFVMPQFPTQYAISTILASSLSSSNRGCDTWRPLFSKYGTLYPSSSCATRPAVVTVGRSECSIAAPKRRMLTRAMASYGYGVKDRELRRKRTKPITGRMLFYRCNARQRDASWVFFDHVAEKEKIECD